MKKPINHGFSNIKFNADLEKLLKKHKIDFGFFITNNVDKVGKQTVAAFVSRPGGRKEKPMAKALLDIFCQINLETEDFLKVAQAITVAKHNAEIRRQRNLFAKIAEEAAICHLSDEDRKQLEIYKQRKNECVAKNDLEKAAKYRALELQLLNKKK